MIVIIGTWFCSKYTCNIWLYATVLTVLRIKQYNNKLLLSTGKLSFVLYYALILWLLLLIIGVNVISISILFRYAVFVSSFLESVDGAHI